MLREKLDAVKAQVEPEKKKWEETREKTRKDFEKELEGGADVKKDDPVVEAQIPVVEKEKTHVKSASSDEDGVMVETPGLDGAPNTTSAGGGGGGGGGKKKKKNKNKN